MPFDAEQAAIASWACHDCGRSSGHPARLSLGDCSYALADVTGGPLLFVGGDFLCTPMSPPPILVEELPRSLSQRDLWLCLLGYLVLK